MAKAKKFKITIEAELDVEEKELREDLGLEREDDLKEAIEATVKDNVVLGFDVGDTEITSVTVK